MVLQSSTAFYFKLLHPGSICTDFISIRCCCVYEKLSHSPIRLLIEVIPFAVDEMLADIHMPHGAI